MVGIALIAALAFVIFRTTAGPTDQELAAQARADWARQDRSWAAREKQFLTGFTGFNMMARNNPVPHPVHPVNPVSPPLLPLLAPVKNVPQNQTERH